MHVEASSTQSGLVWVNGSSGSNNQVNDDKVHHAQVKWYLLTTKPRSEQRASDNLEAQGYEAFFPQFKNTRLLSGKRVQKVEALFPGYLFVKVELTSAQTNFNALRSTRGVGNFVCFGSDPSVVSEQLIAQLKQNLTQSIEVAQKNQHRKPSQRRPSRYWARAICWPSSDLRMSRWPEALNSFVKLAT
jgi:transcription elongation factor/antiterminator RfaH